MLEKIQVLSRVNVILDPTIRDPDGRFASQTVGECCWLPVSCVAVFGSLETREPVEAPVNPKEDYKSSE